MIRAARVGPPGRVIATKTVPPAVAPPRAGTGTLPSTSHAGTPRQPGAHDRARGGPPSVAVNRGLQPANAIGRSVVAQAPSSGRTTGHTDSLPGMAHRTHLGMSGCPARGTSYGSFRDDPRWCRMVAARGSVCGDGLGSPRHVVLAPVAVP